MTYTQGSRVALWRQRRQRGRLSVAVPGRGEVSCAWSGACASDHGYAARQPHRGRQLWDRAESAAQAPARRAGRSLQADQVHTPRNPRHVPGIQTGRKRPGRPAGSTTLHPWPLVNLSVLSRNVIQQWSNRFYFYINLRKPNNNDFNPNRCVGFQQF